MTRTMKPWVVVVVFLLWSVHGASWAEEKSCSVKYVSSEYVYLDAGSTAGLAPGLVARVFHGSETVAVLEVVFTAA